MLDGVQHQAGDVPEVHFIGPCNLCPYMQRITLTNIRDCLLRHAVRGDGARRYREAPRLAVQRMIDLPPPAVPARYDMIKARHHVAVELI
jgi:quinolinate synthase